MAFTVSPTSGASPYFLAADIDNWMNVDGVNYIADIKSTTAENSCPSVGDGSSLSAANIERIIRGEVTNIGHSSVAVGSCRTYTLTITRVSDNVVVGSSSASVDNV